MSKNETWIAGLVAVLLLGLFIFVAIVTLVKADNPPLLGDVAPTGPPQLICPRSSLTPPAPSPSRPAPTGTPGATGQPTSSPGQTSSIPPGVTCEPGQLEYAPQYRSGFDESARLTGLLAVVAPLVTTVVAFYFGHKAGEGAGQAAGQAEAAAAKVTAMEIVRNRLATEPDRDELIRRIETARRP